jgi:PAS domain S-box-containing protein
VDKTAQGTDGGQPDHPRLLGGLAQRLQDGVRATIVALRQSHAQRLAEIVEYSDDAILSVDLNGTIATWNRGATRLFGYEADEVTGQPIEVLMPPERQGEEPTILTRVARGEHVQHYETVRQHKDGRLVPVSVSVSPIKDTSGMVIGASKIARDISARKHFEQELAQRAEEQAALYEFTDRLLRAGKAEHVYEAALDAITRALGCERASILLFDASGLLKFVAWRNLSDGYRRAVEGHSPWPKATKDPEPIAISDIEAADLAGPLKETVKAEGIGALACIPLTSRGELIGKFMTYYGARHNFPAAELDLSLTIARQLGFGLERLRADKEQEKTEHAKELLLAESQHRIKNTLATVQAIARQTLHDDSADGVDAFLARLHALAEAHEVLSTENWHQAPMREVVRRALKPFEDSGHGRFSSEGPDLWLPAQASVVLTMCLHELATNAAKYGALSNSSGQVRLTWEPAGDGAVALIWQETGGPLVNPPTRKGFGSQLIESSGDAGTCLDYRPEGLRCRLKFAV